MSNTCICCGAPVPEGEMVCGICMHQNDVTCGSCKYFIGGGDWNLCCKLKYDLCYAHTKACNNYCPIPENNENERNNLLIKLYGLKKNDNN